MGNHMADADDRQAAWAALFDPATDAATLADIARQYPEFADAIAAHPNCYDGLREWLNAVAPSAVTHTDPGRATQDGGSLVRRRRGLIAAAAFAAAVVAAGGVAFASGVFRGAPDRSGASAASTPAASTPAADGDSAHTLPSPAATRSIDGPAMYVGDELDWFLPSDSDLHRLVPGAHDVTTDAVYGTVGESEGYGATPEACTVWLFSDDDGIVGTRQQSAPVTSAYGASTTVLQFASAPDAAAYFRARADAVTLCRSYKTHGGDGTVYQKNTVTLTAGSPSGSTMVVDETSTAVTGDHTYDSADRSGWAVDGNVVVTVRLGRGTHASASDVLDVVQARMRAAHARLVQETGFR